MQVYCIGCEDRYFYNEEDEDCTEMVCSYCFKEDRQKLNNKWMRIRFRILHRDEFACKYCGQSPVKNNTCILHVDHITPFSRGGTNSEKNLITACQDCNYGKLAIELERKPKESIDEYIKRGQARLREYRKLTEKEWAKQMEDSQKSRS